MKDWINASMVLTPRDQEAIKSSVEGLIRLVQEIEERERYYGEERDTSLPTEKVESRPRSRR